MTGSKAEAYHAAEVVDCKVTCLEGESIEEPMQKILETSSNSF